MSAPVASETPQPVEGKQGDKRMIGRWAEPGSDQHCAELVAVQRDGMRLIIQPRTPDGGGRGVLEELFFDSVFVEPHDGAQPPGHGGAGAASDFQVAGEAFDVGAADGEQGQGAKAAPGGELAQVQRARFARQPAVPGQEPGEGESFRLAERRLDGDENSRRGSGGHRIPPGPG